MPCGYPERTLWAAGHCLGSAVLEMILQALSKRHFSFCLWLNS